MLEEKKLKESQSRVKQYLDGGTRFFGTCFLWVAKPSFLYSGRRFLFDTKKTICSCMGLEIKII